MCTAAGLPLLSESGVLNHWKRFSTIGFVRQNKIDSPRVQEDGVMAKQGLAARLGHI